MSNYYRTNELRETIISISETLNMFSDNVEDSIDSMTTVVQKANGEAVDASSQDFDNFIQDIHQVFDTFNNVLQKLKLTNSIKKYLEIEEIYLEINKHVDQIEEFFKLHTEIQSQKELKEEELKNLLAFGTNRDYLTLTNLHATIQKKIDEFTQNLQKNVIEQEKLNDQLILIQSEKSSLRDWFQALTDEVTRTSK